MKKYAYVFVLVVFVGLVSGCAENQTKIGEGAAIGGILGAAAGGIIGHQTHDDGAGVLIGGAIGAGTGAVVGAQMPKEHPVYAQPGQPVVPINQITMQQIVDWTRQGLPSDEIINRIRSTNSTYALTPEDISYLRRQGVSQRVIETMQNFR